MKTRVSRPADDLRKRPQQVRSEAMVSVIVEAAARILEDRNLEALTTNAVADVAGVSVGSIYQYFPNRNAILTELTRRERSLFRAQVDAAMARTVGAPFEAAVQALIEAAVSHQLLRPRLARALDFVEPSLSLEGETAELASVMVSAVETLLRNHRFPRAPEAARDLVALAKGMIDAAGLAGETSAPKLVQRVRRAALGYLRT